MFKRFQISSSKGRKQLIFTIYNLLRKRCKTSPVVGINLSTVIQLATIEGWVLILSAVIKCSSKRRVIDLYICT